MLKYFILGVFLLGSISSLPSAVKNMAKAEQRGLIFDILDIFLPLSELQQAANDAEALETAVSEGDPNAIEESASSLVETASEYLDATEAEELAAVVSEAAAEQAVETQPCGVIGGLLCEINLIQPTTTGYLTFSNHSSFN